MFPLCRNLVPPVEQADFATKFANRVTSWSLKSRDLTFEEGPALMGILNVTPDSFSDGGDFLNLNAAVAQAQQLIADGAAILDIGGESTRPYAEPVSESDELRRVIPVIERLREAACPIPISIDTSKAKVAKEAIAAGAEIINDITGLEGDPKMFEVAAETEAGICVMHMQGTPQTMQNAPTYEDVVTEIHDYLQNRRIQLIASGIIPERICVDPGIGFGKEHHHNLTLSRNAWRYLDLGPVLIGHSRKGFIAKLLNDKQRDRDPATAGLAVSFALQGVQVIRVHNMAVTKGVLAGFGSTLV